MKLSEGSGVDMSYNGTPVALYRPPSRGAVPYEDWKDDAACDGKPVYFFEYNDEAGEEENHELIARGLKICTACPVRQACNANSTPEDRFWTTRGGQPPEGLFVGKNFLKRKGVMGGIRGVSKSGGGPGRPPSDECQRGHKNWIKYKSGRRCGTCKEMNNKKRYQKSPVD